MQLSPTLCALVVLLGAPAIAETTGERVFRRAGPAIVEVSVLGGWGSGVLVSRDGLILTNRHVADAPLLLAVKATLPGADKPTTFERPRLISTHPTLDLALLKVDAPGVRFSSIDLKSPPKVTTGMECFAIGMPSGQPAREELNASITRGIVSAARVVLPQGAFIQTDAPINPGNSGGALCSADGKVIGLVTAKRLDAEGIGYAIPLSEIKLDEFMDTPAPDRTPGTVEEEVQRIEVDLLSAYQSVGADRVEGIRKGLASYAAVLRQHGPSPGLLMRFGELHLGMEDHLTAAACFEQVLAQDPSHPGARWMLGALAWDASRRKDALALWLEGIEAGPERWKEDPRSIAHCLSGAGQALLQQGLNPAASYCFLWARKVSPEPDSLPLFPKDFEKILAASLAEVPGLARAQEVDAAFSQETLASLRKRSPGRNRADRYASALGEENWFARPTKADLPRLTAPVALPAGATKIHLKSPEPGMRFDEAASEVAWENPPAARGTKRVLVLYELDGQTRYAFALFPAPTPNPDSRLDEVPHE